MQKIPLPAAWTVRAVSNPEEVPAEIANRAIPATVPGCVHLDLLRENLIPDPYLDRNEALVAWIGRTDWEYTTTFSVPAEALEEERVDLVCEGLDTVATIYVNGVEVGRSENMHVESRFEAKAALRAGDNELRIVFASPIHYARQMRDRLGDLPHANSYPDCEPFHFIRKNASNFGWDWGPALTTSGIWKAIRLEAWSVARIKSVRPLVRVANEKVAVVDVEVEFERTDRGMTNISLLLRDDKTFYVEYEKDAFHNGDLLIVPVLIQNPSLWNPRGYGEAKRYVLDVHIYGILEEAALEFDFSRALIGLREVELDTSPDDIGAKWDIKVNGQKIWCKGANWIPDDVFLTRASEPERLRARLEQACAMGMNMIRVWGGGIYETDEFYGLCDELGLLVWQDFPFACAAYSEESPLRELVVEEARQNVARLAKHPSLVLWNGCNENLWGWFDWKWQEEVGARTWGAGYYFDILPAIVAELDPTRPYYPGSPFSGTMDIHPNADAFGPKHMWDTWNEVSHTHFRRYSPRFASEFGHQAPPTFATLARAIPEGERDPFSAAMLAHQKAGDGNAKLHARLSEWFDIPSDFDDWLFLTQLVQARAMTTAVEWFRTRASCSGALFWQLNDCWPVTSWAAIDGDGRPKPLFYAAKQFFRERLLTIQPDGEHLALWAHNDGEWPWFLNINVYSHNMDDGIEDYVGFSEICPARTLLKLGVLKGWTKREDVAYIRAADFDRAIQKTINTAFWFFDADKNLAYPEPKFEATLDGNTLTIEAQTLLRDLYLNADRIGGTVRENLVTLLPGETWSVDIKGVAPEALDLAALTSRPILNCANWFGKGV